MLEAARPSCRAIARKLSPSPLSAASRSLSSSLRCVPPDIAPSRIAVPGQNLTTRPQDVALHARLRPGVMCPLIRTAVGLLALAILAGCASTKVTSRDTYDGPALPRPDRIII